MSYRHIRSNGSGRDAFGRAIRHNSLSGADVLFGDPPPDALFHLNGDLLDARASNPATVSLHDVLGNPPVYSPGLFGDAWKIAYRTRTDSNTLKALGVQLHSRQIWTVEFRMKHAPFVNDSDWVFDWQTIFAINDPSRTPGWHLTVRKSDHHVILADIEPRTNPPLADTGVVLTDTDVDWGTWRIARDNAVLTVLFNGHVVYSGTALNTTFRAMNNPTPDYYLTTFGGLAWDSNMIYAVKDGLIDEVAFWLDQALTGEYLPKTAPYGD